MPGGMTSGQRAVPELGGAAAQTLTRSVTLTLAATLTLSLTPTLTLTLTLPRRGGASSSRLAATPSAGFPPTQGRQRGGGGHAAGLRWFAP